MSKANKAPQADISQDDFENEAKRMTASGNPKPHDSGDRVNTQFGIFQVKKANQFIEEAKLRPIYLIRRDDRVGVALAKGGYPVFWDW